MSEPQSHSNRLTALDGLRGLSSFLVLITHLKLDTPQIINLIGFDPLRVLIRTLMNTGNISVGYFFILCGFLMVLLYESPQSYIGFVQKRYFRIFSVFIVAVCISFGVITLGIEGFVPLLALLVLIPIVLRLAYSACYAIARQKFLVLFFLFIIAVQIAVAFTNYFIVFRIGAQQFYALPNVIHTSFVFLTNATLTFIFSDYIPMLDGGYWSLVTEVMFYLIYPLVAWLLITPIKRLSKRYWILWYFASMITYYGFSVLFQNLLSFETAHVHFAHFFTVGMMIALAYKSQDPLLMKLIKFFETPIGHAVSIFVYVVPVGLAFWLGYISNPFTKYLVAYGFAPFMGLAVIAILAQRNVLARIFNTRLLLFLGAISFPLYVVHAPIVHVLWKMMNIGQNTQSWWVYVLFTVSLSLISALYIHRVVESIYFRVSTLSKREDQTARERKKLPIWKLLALASILMLTMIFVAFQKDFSILTLVRPHNVDSLLVTDSLSEKGVVKGSFIAYEDKLGIVTMRIMHVGPLNPDRGEQEKKDSNTIIFRIRQKGSSQWYHESRHVGWKISPNESYPFGFPEIQSSKNIWYEFEIVSEGATPSDHVVLTDVMKEFRSVYKMSGSTIIRNPWILIPIIKDKVIGAFSTPDAQIIMMIYVFMIWFVWFIRRKAAQAGSVS